MLIRPPGDLSKQGSLLLRALQERACPPLGLLYLAAALEKEGINAGIVDLALFKGDILRAAEAICRASPRVIGVYVTSFDLSFVKTMISRIKKDSKNIKVVIGGPHVNYCPDSVIYLDADFGVVSDGEQALPELVKELLNNGGNFEGIPNLVIREGNGIRANALKMIEDLDALPFPARHLWRSRFYSPLLAGKAASTVTSRGCVFKCSFCGVPNKGSFRARSAENVTEEFGLMQRQGFDYVEILDDTFTYDRKRVELICERLIRRKNRLKWTCLTRIDCVDKALLRLMKMARCTHIKFGIETGSEFIRNKIMKKPITNSQIIKAVRETKRNGIFAEGCFMLAEREESLADIKFTEKFIKEAGLDYIDFHLTWFVPGSEILEKAIKEGRVPFNIWEKVAGGMPMPFSTPETLSLAGVIDLRKKIMRNFYLHPAFLFREAFCRTKDLASFFNKMKILLAGLTSGSRRQ
ncbi:MAG: radical SAM protein [Candidatus Omnitrophica bacterium]|nr:radical SAM protein [Candidatus Omnitrophota bacterium]